MDFDIVKPFSFKNSVLATILTGCLVGCSGAKVMPPPQAESATTLATAQQVEPEPPKPEEKIICKYRKPLGSRISERECMTKKGWDRIAEASRRARDKVNKPAYNRVNPE